MSVQVTHAVIMEFVTIWKEAFYVPVNPDIFSGTTEQHVWILMNVNHLHARKTQIA